MRISSMESLGFIDPPSGSWSVPWAGPSPDHAASTETTQTTELFDIPIGRHTRRVEPTGELVKDIWDSTELHAPSLIDWEPQTFSTAKLGRRNFRWPVLTFVLIGSLAAAGLGYWLFTRDSSATAAAKTVIAGEASRLADAFDVATPLIANLDAERLPDENRDSTVFFEIGEAARSMFAASAELPESDSEDRGAAADAAGLALDASRQLMDATAYRTALEPALTLPLLETDPALTDLTTATAAFTEWRSGFEAIHEALPAGVTGQASAALDGVSGSLGSVQNAYLDALRTEDRAAAVEALGGLRADLTSVRTALITDMGEIGDSVSDLIDQARAELASLLG